MGAASECAQTALFTPIFAPISCSVYPIRLPNCFKECNRYKLEVESGKAKALSLQFTSNNASGYQSLLKHLSFMGCFDDTAPKVTFEELMSKNIEVYYRALLKNTNNMYYPTQLRDALAGLKSPACISDPSARITTYYADIFERQGAIL